MTFYSRKIEMPVTRLQGLQNNVQIIINQIEAGQPEEGLLTAVDLLDTLSGNANPFASVTSNSDNAQLLELKRQHAEELAAAITRAHAQGVADGERKAKRAFVEKLGLLNA